MHDVCKIALNISAPQQTGLMYFGSGVERTWKEIISLFTAVNIQLRSAIQWYFTWDHFDFVKWSTCKLFSVKIGRKHIRASQINSFFFQAVKAYFQSYLLLNRLHLSEGKIWFNWWLWCSLVCWFDQHRRSVDPLWSV